MTGAIIFFAIIYVAGAIVSWVISLVQLTDGIYITKEGRVRLGLLLRTGGLAWPAVILTILKEAALEAGEEARR